MRRLTCLLAMVLVVLVLAPVCFADWPDGPTQLVGGLTALPRLDASTWADLITNGGFETDPVLAAQKGPWTPSGPTSDVGDSTAAWSVDSGTAHSGGRSMKMYGVAKAEAYEVLHLPAGSYTFTGWIKTGSGGTGRARLMLDLRTWRYESVASCTADCGINSWYTSQEISSGANWTQVSISFTITDTDIANAKPNPAFPNTIKAFAVLDGYWAGSRLTAWYDDVKLLQQPAFGIDVFMRYPNYRGMVFSDQDQTLRFRVTPLPQYATNGYYVESTLAIENGVTLETKTTDFTTLNTDPDTGKPGWDIVLNTTSTLTTNAADYQPVLAKFRLLDVHGAEILPAYPPYRVFKVPGGNNKSMMNVTFNTQNQVVLGIPRPNVAQTPSLKMPPQPRFVLGVYDSGLGSVSTSTNWETLLFDPSGARRMSGLPINLYLNYHLGDTDAPTINNLITTLNNHGAAYLQTGNCYSNVPASAHNPPTGFKIDQTDGSYITQGPPNGIGRAVGGYYTADECTSDMIDGVFAQYQRLVKFDPDSMTFGALLGGNDLPRWRDSIDVLSTDPYPLYGSEPTGGYNHGQVAEWTRMAAQAVQHSRPIMTVLQFFKFDASRSSQGRWPYDWEMRSHAYMAIIEGAKGLMWWSLGENGLTAACRTTSQWCSQRVDLMNRLKTVMSDVASLEPVLLTDNATSWSGSVSTPEIRMVVKQIDGKDYIFAYNRTSYYNANVATPSIDATFTLPKRADAIDVHGENRNFASGDTFTDTFRPFEAHVYEITYAP